MVCLGLMRSCTKVLTVKMGGRNRVEMTRTRRLEAGEGEVLREDLACSALHCTRSLAIRLLKSEDWDSYALLTHFKDFGFEMQIFHKVC